MWRCINTVTPNHHAWVRPRLVPFSTAHPPQPSTPKTRSRRRTPSTPTPLTTPQPVAQISTPGNATSNAASRNSTSAQNTSESSDATTGLLVSIPVLLPAPSSCLAVLPLIYHSISEEIPDASRPLVTRIYQLWLVLLATLAINMLACIFILVAGASDGGKDLGGSIGCAFLFPSDRLLIPQKLRVHHPSPLLPLVVQVSSSRLTSALRLHPQRPIYNGYMKVRTLPVSLPNASYPLFRNKPYITVRSIFISPPRVSTFARLVLFLWRFPPSLQCLHVSPSSPLSLPSSLPSLQDHRYPQYRLCWSHPDYTNVLPGSLGSWHPRHFRHRWLVSARRRQCFLLPPGVPRVRSRHPRTKPFPDLVSPHGRRPFHGQGKSSPSRNKLRSPLVRQRPN